jgi:transcriptional regulator with XRE-family HTH domain
MSKASWSEDRAKRIGEQVNALRGKRTGQWLADETARYGHPVSRTTISEIETGKRKDITLAELTVIARALAVPPLLLIYPDLAHGPVDVLPGETVTSAQALRWFAGEAPLPNDVKSFGEDSLPLTRTRRLYQIALELRQNLNALQSLQSSPDAAAVTGMRIQDKINDLAAWKEFMGDVGLNVEGADLDALLDAASRGLEQGDASR